MSAATSLVNYLVNAAWQVPLLFLAAWVLAPMLRRLGPAAEHRLWVAALLAQSVLPNFAAPGLAGVLRVAWHNATAFCSGLFASGSGAAAITMSVADTRPVGQTSFAAAGFYAMLLAYALVTAVFAVRLLTQLVRLRALYRSAEQEVLCEEDAEFLRRASACLHLSRVVIVASSTAARTPLTFGLRRPVLLLPQGFTARVSRLQWHAALSHEVAHIARHDAAKHLLYRVLSLPVAFHPFAALTLARIVNTREQVCDSLAAQLTGGPRTYARTLLELSSLLASAWFAPPNAVGIFDGQQLERRILMLQQSLPIASRTRRALTLASTGLLCMAATVSALAFHRNVATPTEKRAAADAQPARVPANVMAGQVDHRVMPVYPAAAKQAKISGTVLLHAVIGRDGAIENLTVISGPPELQQSALDAVQQWTYKPYLLNGEPTEVETTVTINYSFGGSDEQGAGPGAAGSASNTKGTAGNAPGLARLGEPGTVAPRLLSHVNPVYPSAARLAKIGGEVIVGMKVGTDGQVSDVAALSGPEELRAAATDAARQYVFAPATRDGGPVPVELKMAVKFEVF